MGKYDIDGIVVDSWNSILATMMTSVRSIEEAEVFDNNATVSLGMFDLELVRFLEVLVVFLDHFADYENEKSVYLEGLRKEVSKRCFLAD